MIFIRLSQDSPRVCVYTCDQILSLEFADLEYSSFDSSSRYEDIVQRKSCNANVSVIYYLDHTTQFNCFGVCTKCCMMTVLLIYWSFFLLNVRIIIYDKTEEINAAPDNLDSLLMLSLAKNKVF